MIGLKDELTEESFDGEMRIGGFNFADIKNQNWGMRENDGEGWSKDERE